MHMHKCVYGAITSFEVEAIFTDSLSRTTVDL